jgi:hypothetical protein
VNSPPLYERIGVDPEFDIALEKRLSALTVCLRKGVDPAINKRLLLSSRQQVVLAYYLLDQRREAGEHAAALVAEVEDYLMGGWRASYEEPRWVDDSGHPEGGYQRPYVPGVAGCRREFLWMEAFRDGLLWALALGDGAAAARLAGYAGEDLRGEEFDFGPADKAWRLVATSLVLGGPAAERAGWEGVVEGSRAKKPRLLLAALRAAATGDAPGVGKALAECVRHHLRTEFPEAGLDHKLALDASLVLHVAMQAGLPIDLDPKHRDHFVDISAAEFD